MRLAALLPLLALAHPALAADVQVRVSTVADASGTVRAEICAPAEWLGDGCAHKAVARAVPGTTILTLTGVPPGTWAVVAFHDRNNDGEVDRTLLGIPKEGVGFSRDPALGLSGPRFADSAVQVGTAGAVIDVRLRFE